MVRKNFGLLVVFVLIMLFLYYASYFNSPFGDKKKISSVNYSSDVAGKNGMVVSASKYASRVGIDILKRGGNAVDAAVAVAFALAVTYPQAGNIGGGGFMIIRTKDSVITSIDFREKAPSASARNMYLDEQGNFIPEKSQFGHLSCGVPGSVAGLLYALDKYGTMTRDDVIDPAVDLAENGFEIEPEFAESLNAHYEEFSEFPSSAKIFTKRGLNFSLGEFFVQKDLANTLKLIKFHGRDGFYTGITADLIENEMKTDSGLITKGDLANYQPVERKVLTTNYKGYDVYSMAPPSSGGVALITLLNMIEYDYVPDTANRADYSYFLHTIIESMKRVYADRSEYLGDPDFYDVPVQDLISKNYAKHLRKKITDVSTPSSEIKPGLNDYYKESDQTTHISVIDKDGNMVSLTTTLNNTYGSFVVVDGAGFLLNDEMDDFASKPGEPNMFGLIGSEANSVQPNKRMLSSMTPTVILSDGKPFMILGSPGGGKIITTVFQVILNVVDFKLPLNLAVDKPRFHHQWLPEYVQYEQGAFDSIVTADLLSKGHVLKPVPDFGRVEAVLIDWKNHVYYGHSDSRGYGSAIGY
jgi:gamma-glutamyltranspeptidase / glutathione hydrolase